MSIHLLNSDNVDDFLEQVSNASRLGIDTEFHAERRFTPLLLLIQIYVPGGDTWLIDPTRTLPHPEVASHLIEPEWIVHGGKFDLKLLNGFLGGLPKTVWDTQLGGGLLELKYPASYGHLVQKYLNISLGKHATLSNWARRPLSKEQIKYAAEDVIHLLPLWDSITKELQQRGRLKYAQHYCDAQRTRVLHVPEPSELLHQHHALIHLAPQQACVLQELLFWRYGLAKDNNQPVRSVLSDGHVVELAKRQPSSISSMREDRRMPKKVVSNYGPELIERISRAGSRPEWAWPKYIRKDTPEWVQKHRLLSFVLHDGLANQYGQRLVLPNNHLDAIILEKPDTLHALQDNISSTAFDLAGTRLWAFLSGANGLFF